MNIRKLGERTGIVALLIASVVLIGWITRIQVITSVLPGLVSMKANTAIAFLLLGITVVAVHRKKGRLWVMLPSALAALIGAITLAEVVFNVNLHIDELLVKDFPNPLRTVTPGQMSPLSAFCFLLFGLAFLVYCSELKKYSYRMVLVVLVISLAIFSSYPYSLLLEDSLISYTGMALHTSFLFAILSVGAILAHPQRIWLELIFSNTLFGRQGLQMILVVLLLPLLGGVLILVALRSGIFDFGLAQSMFGVTLMVLLVYLLQNIASFASRDPVTNSFNSAYLKQVLHYLVTQPEARNGNALLFIDLNKFKQVNDTWGHETGDHVLISTSQEIQEILRRSDVFARMGGDEFAIALVDVDRAAAEEVTKRILSIIAKIQVKGKDIKDLGGSIGICYFAGPGLEPEEIIRRADLAMYEAKLGGGARFAFASDVLTKNEDRRKS